MTSSQIGRNYVSLEQAAQLLGVSERTVRSYVTSSRLRAWGGGHGRPLYFDREEVAAFRRPRRGPQRGIEVPAPAPVPADGPRAADPVDWSSALGAQTWAAILAKPEGKRAAAFEKAVRALSPQLIGALRARYPTLSGSTIRRHQDRELPDLFMGADGEEVSRIDMASARAEVQGWDWDYPEPEYGEWDEGED